MRSSARRAIQYPSADRSDRPDIPAHFANLVAALEQDPSASMGSVASRPVNPGYSMYFYWGTDTHLLYFWDGTAWFTVGTSDVIPQTLVDAKGDIIVGLSDNLAGRIALGTNGFTLVADNTQATGMKWAMNATLALIAAKGDLLAGTGAQALARVAPGSNGQVLIADSAQAAGVKWGAAPLNFAEPVHLGSDVAMATAGTWYDGPAISIGAAGDRWLLQGTVTVQNTDNNNYISAKLWDGTNVFASSEVKVDGAVIESISLVGITGTLAGAITARISCSAKLSAVDPKILAAIVDASAGNNASTITAIQVA